MVTCLKMQLLLLPKVEAWDLAWLYTSNYVTFKLWTGQCDFHIKAHSHLHKFTPSDFRSNIGQPTINWLIGPVSAWHLSHYVTKMRVAYHFQCIWPIWFWQKSLQRATLLEALGGDHDVKEWGIYFLRITLEFHFGIQFSKFTHFAENWHHCERQLKYEPICRALYHWVIWLRHKYHIRSQIRRQKISAKAPLHCDSNCIRLISGKVKQALYLTFH